MTRISVIMPIFNCERYLPESVGSVLRQTISDYELICVDDGSTDGSVAYMESQIAQHGSVIKLIRGTHQGPGVARNTALEIATGDYIMFLDADDFIDPDTMSKALAQAEKDSSDIVVWDLWLYNQEFERDQYPKPGTLNFQYFSEKGEPFSWETNPDQLFLSFQNWPWNKLFKRSFLDAHSIRFQQLSRTEDLLFTCMALVQAQKISIIYDRLSHYRIGRADSAMAWKDDNYLDFFYAFTELKKQLKCCGRYEEVRRSFVNWALCSSLYNIESLKTYEGFNSAYQFMKEEGFKQLDITDCASPSYIFVEDWYKEYELIQSLSSSEFLVYRHTRLLKENESLIGLIDKIGAEMKDEIHALQQQVAGLNRQTDALQQQLTDLSHNHDELLHEHHELQQHHKEIMGAAEQKVGQAICKIPRAIQRTMLSDGIQNT